MIMHRTETDPACTPYLAHQQISRKAVGYDKGASLLECVQIIDYRGMIEVRLAERWLVDHLLNSLGLDAFHDALDGGGSELVGALFHDQTVDADGGRHM